MDVCNVRNAGMASLIGLRHSQEDRATSATVGNVSLYAVFDGHGGDNTATFCAENIASSFRDAFVRSRTTKGWRRIRRGLRDGILAMAASNQDWLIGTTANVVAVNRWYILCANVGDSRAILVRHGGVAVALSKDHKVSSASERARMVRAGVCEYEQMSPIYVFAFRGFGLAVSRAIGDRFFHKVGIISTPEICTMRRSSADRFVVIASDGVWDMMSNGVVAAFVWDEWTKLECGNMLADWCVIIAERLCNEAISRGSHDNVTAYVIAV